MAEVSGSCGDRFVASLVLLCTGFAERSGLYVGNGLLVFGVDIFVCEMFPSRPMLLGNEEELTIETLYEVWR